MTELSRWAALEAIRDALDAPPGEADGRVRLQVGVLLLEVLGVPFGYRFARGTYCPASADLLADALTAAQARTQGRIVPDAATVHGLAARLPAVAAALHAGAPASPWAAALGWSHWYGWWSDWDAARTRAALAREHPASEAHADAAIATLQRLGAWGRV